MKNEFKIERNLDKRYSMQNTLKAEIGYIFSSAKKDKATFEYVKDFNQDLLETCYVYRGTEIRYNEKKEEE